MAASSPIQHQLVKHQNGKTNYVCIGIKRNTNMVINAGFKKDGSTYTELTSIGSNVPEIVNVLQEEVAQIKENNYYKIYTLANVHMSEI